MHDMPIKPSFSSDMQIISSDVSFQPGIDRTCDLTQIESSYKVD